MSFCTSVRMLSEYFVTSAFRNTSAMRGVRAGFASANCARDFTQLASRNGPLVSGVLQILVNYPIDFARCIPSRIAGDKRQPVRPNKGIGVTHQADE